MHGHQRTRVPANAPLSPRVKRSTPEEQNDANERRTKRILVHRKWCQTAHAPRSKLPPSTGSGAKQQQQQRQQCRRVGAGDKSSATARDAKKWPSVAALVFRLVCLFVNCAVRSLMCLYCCTFMAFVVLCINLLLIYAWAVCKNESE